MSEYNAYSIVNGKRELIGKITFPIVEAHSGLLGVIEDEIIDGADPLKLGGNYFWMEQVSDDDK